MPRKSIWGSTREMYTGLKTAFFNSYDTYTVNSIANLIAMDVESNGESENYGWLGGLPAVREFLDERQISNLESFSYALTNKQWEDTLGVKRTELDDDKFGQIRIRVNGLADAAVRHKEKLIVQLIKIGLTTTAPALCFDGQYFFDSDHPVKVDNGDGTVTSTVAGNKSTDIMDEAAIKAGITAMRKFTDNMGNELGINPTHLVVGPDLEWEAGDILERSYTFDANSKPNQLKGKLQLLVSPYMTQTASSDYPWALLDLSRPIKPFIFQNRVPVEFQSMQADSDIGFMRAEYLYGIYARYNAGFGLWQLAYGSDGSGT